MRDHFGGVSVHQGVQEYVVAKQLPENHQNEYIFMISSSQSPQITLKSLSTVLYKVLTSLWHL
jgi:hypothetical protein